MQKGGYLPALTGRFRRRGALGGKRRQAAVGLLQNGPGARQQLAESLLLLGVLGHRGSFLRGRAHCGCGRRGLTGGGLEVWLVGRDTRGRCVFSYQ